MTYIRSPWLVVDLSGRSRGTRSCPFPLFFFHARFFFPVAFACELLFFLVSGNEMAITVFPGFPFSVTDAIFLVT